LLPAYRLLIPFPYSRFVCTKISWFVATLPYRSSGTHTGDLTHYIVGNGGWQPPWILHWCHRWSTTTRDYYIAGSGILLTVPITVIVPYTV